MWTAPRTSPARSGGQSQNGGSEALAGRPMRIAATGAKIAALHDGVDEMRRADHDAADLPARLPVLGEFAERGDDAAGHVRRRRRLYRMHDPAVFEQHRVGVGAADIDADPPHRPASNTDLKSRS